MKINNMLCKAALLTSLTLYSFSCFSSSVEMGCKVKSVKLMIIEDGEASEYSTYDGGIDVNDKLKLDINWHLKASGKAMITAHLNHDQNGTTKNQYGYAAIYVDKFISYTDGSVRAAENGDDFMSLMVLHPDKVISSNIDSRMGEGYWKINRYFKNDWVGVISQFSAEGVRAHIITIDCRTRKGSVDALIKEIKENNNLM